MSPFSFLTPRDFASKHRESEFLDRLDAKLKANKNGACRREIQRILALMKKDYEAGRYKTHTEAENAFRRLVEHDEACNPPPLDWTTQSPEAKSTNAAKTRKMTYRVS